MRYLSQCPSCQTNYQLSLMEMNISQGMVRCARCQQVFDAYRCFIFDPEYHYAPLSNFLTEVVIPEQIASNEFNLTQLTQYNSVKSHNDAQTQYVHDVMSASIDGSKLNLYTYLNHLDILHPIHSKQHDEDVPTPTGIYSTAETNNDQSSDFCATERKRLQPQQKQKIVYYLVWGIINLLLILLFVFQIFFFNPDL